MKKSPFCSRLGRCALPIAAMLPLIVSAQSAHAHISVDLGGTHQSRVPGGDLLSGTKVEPCGGNQPRGRMVYTYRPGATINIAVNEAVAHPGYFRISFDDDGDDGFANPSGTSGENGACAGDPACGPGKEDFCNNETVLLDNLDPHSGANSKGTYTWSVTLPNVECDNCTLQIIQMMNDLNVHRGAYPSDDIYYHCIDLVLSNDAPETNDTPVTNNGMVCPRSGDMGPSAGVDAGMGDPGPSTAVDAGMGDMGPGSMGPDSMSPGSMGPGSMGPTTMGPGTTPTGMDTGTGNMTPPGTTPGPATGPGDQTGNGVVAGQGAGPVATTSSDDGGCTVASGRASGLLAPVAFALVALGVRRRRRR